MDEFGIYLDSTGSLETYRQNNGMLPQRARRTFTTRRRVALAEILFPTSIKNVTTNEYFVYTPKTPFNSSPSTSQEALWWNLKIWSNNVTFPYGDYKTVKDVVTRLHVAVAKSTKLIVTSSTEEDSVGITFSDGYGKSLHDISLVDAIGFKAVLYRNWGRYFIANNNKVKKQTRPIKGDYPADITAGTNIFLVNCDITEHQPIAGVKAPILRVIDTERRLTNGNLLITFATKHKSFCNCSLKSLCWTQSGK